MKINNPSTAVTMKFVDTLMIDTRVVDDPRANAVVKRAHI